MCTVTFLPLPNNNFILTSNRDEQNERQTNPPKKYVEDGVEMVFPMDKTAGGTWIGTSDKKRLVCVLNGAYKKHVRKKYYKKSRGILAKEVLKANKIQPYIQQLDLINIEPFTMLVVDWSKGLDVYELIWDDSQKHFKKLKNEPHIWSSSTLYSDDIKKVRKKWFKHWVMNHEFNSEQILAFHHSEIGNKEQSVLMKRSYAETVSITSIKKENKFVEIRYEDLVNSQNTVLKI